MSRCPRVTSEGAARRGPVFLMLAAALVAGACTQSGQEVTLGDGPFAPGVDTNTKGADTSIDVGHRLMNAGEYELALRAYYRTASAEGMSPVLLSSIGAANLGLERLEQAEALLRKAIEQDKELIPAWNNLGVVLVEKGEIGEASRVFRTAFALDAGNSPEIRENLRLALANMEPSDYTPPANDNDFTLIRQERGQYLLLSPE